MHVPGRRLPLHSGQPLSPWTTTRPRMCISRGISKGSLSFTPASLPLACGPRRNETLGLFPELCTRQGRTLPRASGRGRAMGTARITSLASASLLRRTHSLRATTRRNIPDTCPAQPTARRLPAQGVVALFPEKRAIYHAPADLMMRHWVGEAAPELDHLRADAACSGATSSNKYSAGRTGWRRLPPCHPARRCSGAAGLRPAPQVPAEAPIVRLFRGPKLRPQHPKTPGLGS